MIYPVAIALAFAAELGLLAALAVESAPSEVDWLTKAGVVGVLAFFLWAFLTNRIISGKTHDKVVSERDRLLELAITNSHVAARATELVERVP